LLAAHEKVYQAFSAICETRMLNAAGYVRFRNFLLYGEHGLAGQRTLVTLFQETLTLEYGDAPLSRYSVEWQPDEKHFRRVGNPRLYDHPYPSPQVPLWEPGEVEWYVILRCAPPVLGGTSAGEVSCCNCHCEKSQMLQRQGAIGEATQRFPSSLLM
jgi:hypothetical protein